MSSSSAGPTAEFEILMERDEDGFVVWCPALKGCQSFGLTQDEARANIKDAIRGWLITAARLGIGIPHRETIRVVVKGTSR